MKNTKQEKKIFGPASEKQRLLLMAQEDVILTGGGAGGSKSYSCLLKNLDAINDPHMHCVIARKSRPELTRPGGLVSESKPIYSQFKGSFNKQELRWTFPAGGDITFLGIPDSSVLGSLQGMQASRIIIDEVCDGWEMDVVLFLASRLRSAGAKHKAQMIMTCNPDSTHWMKDWLDYCLDPESGVPVEGTENMVRWFIVLDGKVHWADSAEECFEKYGKKRGMIFGLNLTEEEMLKVPVDRLFLPKSFRFIPMTVYDNPYLLPPRNTTYLANLLAQPKKFQLKYLHGSWLNIDVGQNHFKRSHCHIIYPQDIPQGIQWVRSYDLAATPVSEVNRNPDFTAGVLLGRHSRTGDYYVADLVKYRERPAVVLENIIRQSDIDGQEIPIIIPKDSGQGGRVAADHYNAVLSEAGCIVRTEVQSGHRGKLQKGLPFCQMAEAGKVYVVKGEWNDTFFDDMESFIGTPETLRKIHDDKQGVVAKAI